MLTGGQEDTEKNENSKTEKIIGVLGNSRTEASCRSNVDVNVFLMLYTDNWVLCMAE